MATSDLAGDYKEYFEYLLDLIDADRLCDGKEMNLLRLFERKYYWTLPIDGNMTDRVEELRINAMRIGHVSPIAIPNDEPSVLEILVALSIMVALDLMYDPDTDVRDQIPVFFDDLHSALGFDCYCADIDGAVDDFLSGKSKIADPHVDREVTLWEQCNYFYRTQFNIENDGN